MRIFKEREETMKKRKKTIGLVLAFLISFFAFLLFTFTMLRNKVLPLKYRIIIIIFFIIIFIILYYISLLKSTNNTTRIVVLAILVVLTILFYLGHSYISQGVGAINKLNEGKKVEVLEYSLVVRKDSEIKEIGDIGNTPVHTASEQDAEGSQLFKDTLKEKNIDLSYVDGSNYTSLAKELEDGEADVILLHETYRRSIEDHLGDFSEQTRVVYSTNVEKKIDKPIEVVKPLKMSNFNIYISGIDTYGSISTVSRTDVNLVLTVNSENKTMLITSIPRDSYVPIAGGGNNYYDKLTHSGIYGISSSIETLENLLDTSINYYARVNFNSIIDVVDALGGIDIYNPVEFQSDVSDYHYPQGKIHLDGDETLFFARERKNLPDGDMDRGRNHIRIIKAIIEKGLSPAILFNYSEVLDSVIGAMETNMPYDEIITLINNQIADNKPWTIHSTNIVGYGTTEYPSYAMPGYKLFMYIPFDESVAEVREEINAVEAGKPVVIKEKKEEDYNENDNFYERVMEQHRKNARNGQ